jgi:hypothetical protein
VKGGLIKRDGSKNKGRGSKKKWKRWCDKIKEVVSLGPSVVEKVVDSRYRYDNDMM